MSSLFDIPINRLKGVGEARAKSFAKLGVRTIGDLIYYFPRTYNYWNLPVSVADAGEDTACCLKLQIGSAFSENYIKGGAGRFISKVSAHDESGAVTLVFFNNKYISKMLLYGEEYLFYGKLTRDLHGIQMVSPEFSRETKKDIVVPIYPATAGITSKQITQAVQNALQMLPDEIPDTLPEKILKKYKLMGLRESIFAIHNPQHEEDSICARKRLAFEELLVLNLGLRQIKGIQSKKNGVKIQNDFSEEFQSLLDFEMTGAQKRVIAECINDMVNKGIPMNRLIQGDVGSGKTAVAASVCYSAIKNGYQAAFMAPTEVLAQQHYQSFKSLFENVGISVEMLSGSMKKSEKDGVKKRLKSGEISLVIGTHALITGDTEFDKLALVITDEQHRFGVGQRSELLRKGDNPHLLVMSATPIPRTLGLIIFGDLDISVIDEMPPGRIPVKTRLISGETRSRAYGFIKENVKNGHQCYIVCPLVEDGETEAKSAESHAAELMLSGFSEIPVGVLHGKMKPREKQKIMNDFVENRLSVLVSTTVIEVGVNVPNATVMLIENAERFGLSQLHQLRGRVGRGGAESWCIMISDSQNESTLQRLSTMCRTNNGFEIADEDLKQRGPGDFFGQKQHGLPELKIAELSDSETVAFSSEAAEEILKNSPNLSDAELRFLKEKINRLFNESDKVTL